jgi:hypothetical protein
MEHGFADRGGTGILFLTAAVWPGGSPLAAALADRPHAIGDRGGHRAGRHGLAWDGDRAASRLPRPDRAPACSPPS